MITLLCITHNPVHENIVTMLGSLPSIVTETIMVNQNSTDLSEETRKLFTQVFDTTHKGYNELDMNYYQGVASNQWILYLDDDECLSEHLKYSLSKLLTRYNNIDGYLLYRVNFVDGVVIPDSMEGDVLRHPRLFKKGTVVWSNRAHTMPQLNLNRTVLPSKELAIIHNRSLAKLIKSNKAREQYIDEGLKAMQNDYILRIKNYLKEQNQKSQSQSESPIPIPIPIPIPNKTTPKIKAK